MPRSVYADEALFHSVDPVTNDRTPITLGPYVDDGRIAILEADDIEAVENKLPKWIAIDLGEKEAIAIMLEDKAADDAVLCSSDRAGVRAATIVGLGERCMSLEALLEACGLGRALPAHFSKASQQQWVQEGSNDRINLL